jgi:hypothetical protein
MLFSSSIDSDDDPEGHCMHDCNSTVRPAQREHFAASYRPQNGLQANCDTHYTMLPFLHAEGRTRMQTRPSAQDKQTWRDSTGKPRFVVNLGAKLK